MAELSTADGSDTTSSEDGFSIGLPPVGGASHPVSLERNPQLDRDVGAVVTFFQAIRYGAQLDVPALVLGLRDQNAALHTELQKQRDEVARLQAEVSAQAAQLRAAEAAKSALSSDVTKLHAAVRGLTLRAQASWLPTRRSAVMLRAGASSPPLRGVHALSSGPHADLLVGGHSADSHFLQGPSGIAPLQLSASQADGSAPAASSGLAAGAVASVVGAVSSMSSSVTSSVSSLLRGGLPLQLPFGGQGQGQGQSSSSSVLADGHSSELALEGSPALPANAVPRSRSSRPSTGSASSSIASVASVASAPGSVSRQPPRPPTPSGPAGVSAGPGPGPAHRTSSTSSGHSAGAAAVSVVLPMSSWLGDSSHRHAADAGAAETAVAAVDDVVPGGSGSCEPLPSHTSQRESVESEADAPAAAHIASGGRQTAGRARTRRQLCAQCRQKLRRNPGGHDSAGSAEGTSTDDQDEAGVDDDRGDGYVGSERAGLSDSDELLLSDGDTGDEADGEPDNAALPPVGSEDAATATGRRSRGTTATGSGWPLPRPSFPRVPSPPFMLSRYGRAQVAGQAERSATATTSAPAALSRDDGSAPSALDAASASATSSFSPALASPSIISAATSAVANAGGALSDAIRRRLPSWGGAGSQPGAGAGPAADAPSREPPSSYGSAVASSTLGLNPLPVGRPPRPAAVPAVANAASARIAQAAASSSSSSSPGHSISTTAAAVAERDSHMPLLPADALYDSVQCEPLGPPAPAPPHDRDGDNHDAAAASHLPPVMAVEVPLSPQGGDAIGTVDTSAEPVHRRRTEGAGQSRHPRLPQGSRRRDHGRDGGHGTASASTDAWKHRFRHLTAGRGLEEATGAVLAELTRVMLSMEAAAAAAAAAASTRVPADATANASAAASAASSSCEAEGSGTAQRRQSKRPKLQADSEGSRDTQLLLSRCLALQLPLLALVQELADRSAFAGTPLAWHGGSERTLSQLQLSAHAQALLAGTDAPLATGATPSALSTAASALVAGSRAGAGAASAVPTQAGSADRTASGAAALSEKAPDEGGAAKASSLDVDADLDASAFVSPVPAFASPALASPPLQAGPSPISHFALAPALAPAPASAQSPSPSPSPWPAAIAAAAGGDSNSAAGSGSSSASTVAAATADPLSDSEERAVAAEGAEAVAEAEERAVAAEAAEAVAEAAEAEAAHELSPTELSELSAAPAAQEPQLVSAIALHALHDVETDVATDAGAGADAAAREEAGGDTQSGAARLAAFIADGGSPPFAPAAAGPSPSLSDVGSAGNCTSAVAHAEPSVPPASPQAAAQAPFLPLPPRILKRFPWLAAAMERASPEARATALAVLIRHAGFSAGGPVPAFDRVPRSVTHMPARPTAGQLASLLQPGIALPVPSLSHAPGPSAPLSPRRGLRILVLDGGGMRGLLELEILKRLEAEAGRPICDLFDLICGTRRVTLCWPSDIFDAFIGVQSPPCFTVPFPLINSSLLFLLQHGRHDRRQPGLPQVAGRDRRPVRGHPGRAAGHVGAGGGAEEVHHRGQPLHHCGRVRAPALLQCARRRQAARRTRGAGAGAGAG